MLKITMTEKALKRKADINQILKKYKEIDVPDSIINKIKKKYNELKNYEYLHTEQIVENELIQMVSLDLKHLSIIGRCIKITYTENNTIETILLTNNYLNIFWRINPRKYYVFKAKSKNENNMANMIGDFYEKNNINKKINLKAK